MCSPFLLVSLRVISVLFDLFSGIIRKLSKKPSFLGVNILWYNVAFLKYEFPLENDTSTVTVSLNVSVSLVSYTKTNIMQTQIVNKCHQHFSLFFADIVYDK